MRASGSGGNLKASASFIKKAITAQAAVAQKLAKVREAAPPPVMRVNGVELNQQQVDDFKEMFEFVDLDGSGTISASEVAKLLAIMGIPHDQASIKAMMAQVDADNSGEIDFDEFLQMLAGGTAKREYTQKDLLRNFRVFADRGLPPGCILQTTLENVLLTYCSDMTSMDEILRLIDSLEPNQHGIINYQEQVQAFFYGR